MGDEAPWTDPVVVPDDARELQPDIDAYHRELRYAARRRRLQRVTRNRWWQRFGVPATVTAGALALATVVFAVLTFGAPRPQPQPVRAPVAASVAAAPGTVGGLMPDVTVQTLAGETSTRDFRPGLIALVPLRCDCTELISDLAGQAEEVALPLVVVAPAAKDAEVYALPHQVHRGQVVPVFDANGTLARTFKASGVTAVVVAANATVTFVRHDVDAQTRLQLELPLHRTVAAAG